jgi:hypothetical protein
MSFGPQISQMAADFHRHDYHGRGTGKITWFWMIGLLDTPNVRLRYGR